LACRLICTAVDRPVRRPTASYRAILT
jgi:hypothetical protein